MTTISTPGYQPNEKLLQEFYLHDLENEEDRITVERLQLNDCLYRNIHRYKYIAIIDNDELILPLKKELFTWKELFHDIERQHFSNNDNKWSGKSKSTQTFDPHSFSFRMTYFMDTMLSSQLTSTKNNDDDIERIKKIPDYLYMARHVYRSPKHAPDITYAKSIHNTDYVKTVSHHFSLECLHGPCYSGYIVDKDLSHLQHYRDFCQTTLEKVCKKEYMSSFVKDTTIWKYKQKLMHNSKKTLEKLNLL